MEPEESDPRILRGWQVRETGRRQAWPFINLADPISEREIRIYIDSDLSVTSGKPDWISQDDPRVLVLLDVMTMQTVEAVHVSSTELHLSFHEDQLRLSGVANSLTSHSPWWIGRVRS